MFECAAVYTKGPNSCLGTNDDSKVSYELRSVKNGSQQSEHSIHLQFFFDKAENASQVAEIVNNVYGTNTVTASYVQFCFRQFRSGILDVKVTPNTGRLVAENVEKITEIIEVDRRVSSRSITEKLKIDNKTVLNQLC
ncbi:histone-lysine N-methyltransferase SETMAR [Trichonephila clavipes]|nr:histone-lysine N-methyltransferase SETMAR [Trichonephila clavipes]